MIHVKLRGIGTSSRGTQPIDKLGDDIYRGRFIFSTGFQSIKPVAEMIADACIDCLERSRVEAGKIEHVIIVSESFWDAPDCANGRARIYRDFRNEVISQAYERVGLLNATIQGLWMAACGNLIPAMESAYSSIASGQKRNIIIVCADRVSPDADRLMQSRKMEFSDVAAAAILSSEGEGPFLTHVSVRSSRALHKAYIAQESLLVVLEIRRELNRLRVEIEKLAKSRGLLIKDVLFENLGADYESMLRSHGVTAGLSQTLLEPYRALGSGHAFSADLLLALQGRMNTPTSIMDGTLLISLASWTTGIVLLSHKPRKE